MVLGIDPGLNGGLVFLSDDGVIAAKYKMPSISSVIDLPAVCSILDRESYVERAYLEQASCRPLQGAQSTFTFGRGFGALEGVLAARKIPYELVAPAKWAKAMHAGISGDEPKKKSLIAVSRLFPGIDLRASDRCRVPHDGIVDALLIAEYGRRIMVNFS